MTRALLLAILVAGSAPAADDAWLDRVDRALTVSSPGGLVRADLSGLLDVEGYWIDQRPPGLIFADGPGFANPRLSLFLDTHVGRQLYGFVQARFDRGFDPGEPGPSARLDEYLVRWTPLPAPRLNLQFGKFATMVGNWVARHDSWSNPFVDAPLPYANVTIVSDVSAPATAADFLARRNLPDRKRIWLPVIWGPNYATGGAVFGHLDRVDWAVEVKNAALASRPYTWDPLNRGWDHPTTSAHLGWRPAPAWTIGSSFSTGSYLRERAQATLAPGQGIADLRESVIGVDGSFAWRHLTLWAEFFAARFDVPLGGSGATEHADTEAYYVEGRYKLTPALFAALRWNQQFFGQVPDGHGGDRAWDHDIWRVDTAVGWRFDRHLQAKLEYAFSRQTGPLQQGEQLVAAQLTLKF